MKVTEATLAALSGDRAQEKRVIFKSRAVLRESASRRGAQAYYGFLFGNHDDFELQSCDTLRFLDLSGSTHASCRDFRSYGGLATSWPAKRFL